MEQTGCIIQKLPVVLRVPADIASQNISLPAPCYLAGEIELAYVYFAIGLVIPAVAIVFLQKKVIQAFLKRVFTFKHGPRRTKTPRADDEDDLDGEECANSSVEVEREARANMRVFYQRVMALADRKAKRTWIYSRVIEAANSQTSLGQALMGIAVVCSCVSLAIYLKAVLRYRLDGLESCGVDVGVVQAIDLFMNAYLLCYFIICLGTNHKKLPIVKRLQSFGDYFNAPATFAGLFLHRQFTGFGFLRLYNFVWLVEILAYRRIIRSTNKIRLINLVILCITLVTYAAGFLHLAENTGDPWLFAANGSAMYNGQSVPFWRCYLYVYGRVTLLDLSGIRLHTHAGRIIIYGFQLLALGIVGKAIPQILLLLKIKPDYDKPFSPSSSFLHILVCGHVTSNTMKNFLKEFYHAERTLSEHLKVVILCEVVPDEEMRSLTERYYGKLEYKRGTVMNLKDLDRVKLKDAAGTLILANRTATDPDADDAANIMRVVSVKNLNGKARVIVQLSQYHNKAYLQNIPTWDPVNGDVIICIAEMRLGLLAQSCQAPGFSTLMANLFTTRTFDERKKYKEAWMADYLRGSAMELYYLRLSPAFWGMPFGQVCQICYTRLKLVLLAVQSDPLCEGSIRMPLVNPHPKLIIGEKMFGYCMADHRDEVHRAEIYCFRCHSDIQDPKEIDVCKCDDMKCNERSEVDGVDITSKSLLLPSVSTVEDPVSVESKLWSFICNSPPTPRDHRKDHTSTVFPKLFSEPNLTTDTRSTKPHLYDSSGMFYWTPARSISAVIMSRVQAATNHFKNHVIVCVMSAPNSHIMGLASLVMPLRSSAIKADELADILFVGDREYLEKEWRYLYNFPRIFVVEGTALNRSDLRAVNLNTCRMCLIVGAPSLEDKSRDPSLLDKSAILATLNVRAMKFSPEESGLVQEKTSPGETPRTSGEQVPLITDLMRDSNAQFLDDDDEDSPGTEFHLTQPYSGGRAFSASVLDLLMVTSCFNPVVNNLIRSIIFGATSLELERIMAEGAGLIGGEQISTSVINRDQVRVVQFPLNSGPLQPYLGATYGGLFIGSLTSHGLLVLGLFRRIHHCKSEKRYVICNPPDTFELRESDAVFALQRVDKVAMCT